MRAVHPDERLWCFRPVRIYVYAGNYDKTLKSLFKVYEAVIIHGADVARVEPHSAVCMGAQRSSRFGGIVEIALHNGGTAYADFTLCIGRKLAVVLRIDYLIVNVRIRYSDTALAEKVTRGKAGRRNALRCTIALSNLYLSVVLL